MYLDRKSPENAGVLAYLCLDAGTRKNPSIEPPPSGSTWHYGSHPDIIEYLWESLAPQLAADCRALVCGKPALVSPRRGVIFAVALGTEFALRLPPAEFALAQAAGTELVHHSRTAQVTLDLPARFGTHWVFGSFDPRESEWCVAALEFAERA